MRPNWLFMLLAGITLFISATCLSVIRPFIGSPAFLMVYVLIMALIGIYLIYTTSYILNEQTAMSVRIMVDRIVYIGRNTLSILTWHFLSFKLLDFTLVLIYEQPISAMVSMYRLPTDMFFKNSWILYSIVGVVLPLIMTNFANKSICKIKLIFKKNVKHTSNLYKL